MPATMIESAGAAPLQIAMLRSPSMHTTLAKVGVLKAQAEQWEEKGPGLAPARNRQEAAELLLEITGIKLGRGGVVKNPPDSIPEHSIQHIRDAIEQFKLAARNYANLFMIDLERTQTGTSENAKLMRRKALNSMRKAKKLTNFIDTREHC